MSVKAAALSIHELASPEREAVLRALSPEERARIMPFLEQLKGLGIPAGAASKIQPEAPPKPVPDGNLPDSHRRCAALPAETVLACTQRQSAHTLGVLLSIRTWPWAQEVLERLPESRKREVRQFIQAGSTVVPAVQAVLLEALIAAAGNGRLPSERIGFLRRLAAWKR